MSSRFIEETNMGKKPNFLIILADDLGFSDTGCFGSEINTPSVNQLGKDGTRFTDFHTAAQCAPTRSMLMSGTDHHLVGLGQLVEFLAAHPSHQGKLGHEGYLTSNVATLPEVLRDNGYHTMMSGKWHLGLKVEHAPVSRGFTRSFTLLGGGGNHFGWEPRPEATMKPPLGGVALHMEDDQYVDNTQLPRNFYSSDTYVDKLLQFMDERPKEKPFFAYLAFSAVHWPLQCPKENSDRYKGRYDEGPDVLRLRRLAALKREGLVPEDVVPHPVVAPEVPEWNVMDDKWRAKSARSMEVYAGMVDRMDYNIGRVLAYLKDNEMYDDTEIYFMSDNGAEGVKAESVLMAGGDLFDYIEKYYDNSLDNIGRRNSFVWYGARWSQAATAPSRLNKSYSTEGGVRVPLIVKPTAEIKNPTNICHEFCTIMDLMPTFLEKAGAAIPGKVYNGREVLSMRGASWVPYFSGKSSRIHEEDHVTGWELIGQAALRKGEWKINFVNKPKGPEVWQLYDLSKDPGEINDLASTHKDKLEELLKEYEAYAKETGVVGLTPEFAEIIARDGMEDISSWMRYETAKEIAGSLNFPTRIDSTIP